jgi:hypothetical protein
MLNCGGSIATIPVRVKLFEQLPANAGGQGSEMAHRAGVGSVPGKTADTATAHFKPKQ